MAKSKEDQAQEPVDNSLMPDVEDNAETHGKPDYAELRKKIKCLIPNQTGDGGKDAVFIRIINDIGFYEAWIPRDIEVEIPVYVFNELVAAEGYELVAQKNAEGKTEMVSKPYKRYRVEKL